MLCLVAIKMASEAMQKGEKEREKEWCFVICH
jgi:hypothetical protein